MATQLLFAPLMAFKNGVFSPGATVEFYLSGTTTAVTVTDVDGNTIAQPMAADSAGVFAEVYRSGGDAIKAVIKDSDGATIATVDPIAQVNSLGSSASSVTFSPVTGNTATDVQTAIANNTTEINLTKAIGALETNGHLVRTAAATYAARTQTAGNGVTITNGDGVSGNPTYTLNYATQAEAEAGTDTVKPLNALRTKQAIAAYYTREAEVATTTGTSQVITGIDASAVEVHVMLNGVSLSGTDELLVQIGDSGGVETTGYVSSGAYNGTGVSSTSGFIIKVAGATRSVTGVMTLRNQSGNKWIASFVGNDPSTTSYLVSSGVKTLTGTLDRVQIASSGTDTLDAGVFNVSYR